MNAPIRVRLTAWYVLVLAGVLLLLGAFVVTRLRSNLTHEVDAPLRSGAAQIARGYSAEGATEFVDVVRTVVPGPQDAGSGAQVLDASGRVVVSEGDRLTRRPLLHGVDLRRVLGGGTFIGSVHRGSPDRHVRMFAQPTTRLGRRQAVVVVESLASVDAAVHRALILLLLGSAAALALVAAGGWWIARKALEPVARMTSRADRIGIHDLSERIPPPEVRDELGDLARTLNAMLDRLERGVEARERLVADASHELRSPLAAMRSEIEVSLRQDRLSASARAVLGSVLDEVIRMSRTVNDLLTLARVDAGQLDLSLGAHDLRELAAEGVRLRRAAAEAADVELVADGESVELAVDRNRFGQLIGNLVDNAIRFAPPGTEVHVTSWRDGDRAGIRVSDAGPGVPEDARERIFERFTRQDAARSRSGGAGLGLAICQEIARAHGGRIWVEGREPQGSTFVVELPLRRPAARRGAALAPA